MKFFKENPIFSVVLIVLLLLFFGGAYMDYTAFEKSRHHEAKEGSAEAALKRALRLNPAPTEANLEAAKANVAALQESLHQQVETTKGTNPELIDDNAPTDPTRLLFELQGYRNELAQEAKRTIPINVNEESVAEGNIPNPGVKIPDRFAFGFSRYLQGDTGVPPRPSELKKVYLQKQILNYILENLLDTRPIEIKAVQREGVAEVAVAAAAPAARRGRGAAAAQSDPQQQQIQDEFQVGKETAAVKDVVETLGFRVVFTGYTENLRQFMKSLETFELPLVVRSVSVKPLESSVRDGGTAPGGRPGGRSNAGGLDALFGSAPSIDPTNATQTKRAQEPVVAENISEYTVVIEYITVTLPKSSTN